jgi:hypothetical protein
VATIREVRVTTTDGKNVTVKVEYRRGGHSLSGNPFRSTADAIAVRACSCEDSSGESTEGALRRSAAYRTRSNYHRGGRLPRSCRRQCDCERIATQYHRGYEPPDRPLAVGIGANKLRDVIDRRALGAWHLRSSTRAPGLRAAFLQSPRRSSTEATGDKRPFMPMQRHGRKWLEAVIGTSLFVGRRIAAAGRGENLHSDIVDPISSTVGCWARRHRHRRAKPRDKVSPSHLRSSRDFPEP